MNSARGEADQNRITRKKVEEASLDSLSYRSEFPTRYSERDAY